MQSILSAYLVFIICIFTQKTKQKSLYNLYLVIIRQGNNKTQWQKLLHSVSKDLLKTCKAEIQKGLDQYSEMMTKKLYLKDMILTWK